MAELARDCEQFGFESIWTVEHVVIPQPHMPYPGSKDGQMPGGDDVPIPDPLIALAYAAALTTKLRLSTGVIILPQRHPLYLAEEIAMVGVFVQFASAWTALLGRQDAVAVHHGPSLPNVHPHEKLV